MPGSPKISTWDINFDRDHRESGTLDHWTKSGKDVWSKYREGVQNLENTLF